MGKTRGKNFFPIAILAVIVIFIAACDKNIARPEDLAALTSVSVDELTVGSDTLIAGGDGTTLCWKVTDDDGVLQKVELATDDGDAHTVAEEDCEGINPDHSTMYSVNAYVDGEIAKTKSVYVSVLSEDGSEITETPSVSELPPNETACDDGEDEDGDDAADCDDSDCAADDACYVAPTYAFSSGPSFDPQEPVIGDTVTVTWSSNFQFVTVYLNGVMDSHSFGAEDSYALTASGSDTVMLKGWGADGVPVDAELSIAATSVAHTDFEGSFTSFKATPSSNLIAGDTYVVSWEVDNARSAQMGSDSGLTGSTDPITASEGTQTYTLSATDSYGNTDSRSLTVSVKGFSSLSDVMGDVSEVQPGAASGEYYFAGSGGIYHTADTLASAPEELGTGGISGTIMALAVDGDKMYVGTTAGVYFRSGTEGDFTEVLTTGGRAEVHALAILNDGTVLVGTDEVLYEMSADHVLTGVKDFAGNETVGDYSANPINFTKIVQKSAGSSVLVVVTESDGTYLSTDGGASFVLTGLDGITGGFAKTGGSTYIWSESEVYEYQSDTASFATVDELDGVSGIHFVTDAGGRLFAATAEGVVCGDGDSLFTTDLTDDTAFVLGGGSASGSVTAVTDNGSKASLSFSGSGARVTYTGVIISIGVVNLGGRVSGISF